MARGEAMSDRKLTATCDACGEVFEVKGPSGLRLAWMVSTDDIAYESVMVDGIRALDLHDCCGGCQSAIVTAINDTIKVRRA
jgi:hypothetical protein